MTQRQEFIERFVAGYLAAFAMEWGYPLERDVEKGVAMAGATWLLYVGTITREQRAALDLVPLLDHAPKVPDAPAFVPDDTKEGGES